jgi:hypothetical protein
MNPNNQMGEFCMSLKLLTQGTRVEIKSHTDDSPYITTVESVVGNESILLDIVRLGGSEARLSENKSYVLRFYVASGVIKYSGMLRGYRKKGTIDYMLFQTLGQGEKVQRRQAFRLPCGEDTDLTLIENVEDERINIKGFIRDISSGGVRVLTKEEIDPSNLIELTLPFVSEKFWVFATILLKQPIEEPDAAYRWAYGMEFIGLSEEDSEKISLYVFNKQQASRSRK